MIRKISWISILLISLLSLGSCITPGPSKPAADALILVEEDLADIADSLAELITNSDLSDEAKRPILDMLKAKHDSAKEKIAHVLKYLSTLDGLDWKQYAAILYTDAQELKRVIDKVEKGGN